MQFIRACGRDPSRRTGAAALAGAFDPGRADADLQAVADTVAKRLNLIAPEFERGWQGRITQDHGIRLSRVKGSESGGRVVMADQIGRAHV